MTYSEFLYMAGAAVALCWMAKRLNDRRKAKNVRDRETFQASQDWDVEDDAVEG